MIKITQISVDRVHSFEPECRPKGRFTISPHRGVSLVVMGNGGLGLHVYTVCA